MRHAPTPGSWLCKHLLPESGEWPLIYRVYAHICVTGTHKKLLLVLLTEEQLQTRRPCHVFAWHIDAADEQVRASPTHYNCSLWSAPCLVIAAIVVRKYRTSSSNDTVWLHSREMVRFIFEISCSRLVTLSVSNFGTSLQQHRVLHWHIFLLKVRHDNNGSFGFHIPLFSLPVLCSHTLSLSCYVLYPPSISRPSYIENRCVSRYFILCRYSPRLFSFAKQRKILVSFGLFVLETYHTNVNYRIPHLDVLRSATLLEFSSTSLLRCVRP